MFGFLLKWFQRFQPKSLGSNGWFQPYLFCFHAWFQRFQPFLFV